MRIPILFSAVFALTISPAAAFTPIAVPEMEYGAGIAAIALLVGVAAIIRERKNKK